MTDCRCLCARARNSGRHLGGLRAVRLLGTARAGRRCCARGAGASRALPAAPSSLWRSSPGADNLGAPTRREIWFYFTSPGTFHALASAAWTWLCGGGWRLQLASRRPARKLRKKGSGERSGGGEVDW